MSFTFVKMLLLGWDFVSLIYQNSSKIEQQFFFEDSAEYVQYS